MKFSFSEEQLALRAHISAFMNEHVYPAEAVFYQLLDDGISRWQLPAIVDEMKSRAREADLWNLFLPDSDLGAGLSNLDYAPLAETMGRSPIAMIKVIVPSMAVAVIDRAIQVHGVAGVCDDFGLARAWARARNLRLPTGPTRRIAAASPARG